jgi:flagellar protein FlgJ
MDSFGLSGVDSNYTDFLKRSASASSALNSIKNVDGSADDEKMMNACKEFEAYLLEMVMKEVTKSTNLFGLDSDSSTGAMSLIADNAKDTMIQTAASKLTEGGELGIAQKLYDAMKQQASMKTWDEIQAEATGNPEQKDE